MKKDNKNKECFLKGGGGGGGRNQRKRKSSWLNRPSMWARVKATATGIVFCFGSPFSSEWLWFVDTVL